MLKYRLSGAWAHDVQVQQDNGLSTMGGSRWKGPARPGAKIPGLSHPIGSMEMHITL